MPEELSKEIFHGGRAWILLNSVKIGRATGCTGTITYQNQIFEEAGETVPTAIVTVGSRISISMSKVRITNTDVIKDSLVPRADTDYMLDWSEMTLEIQDRRSKNVMYKVTGAKPQQFRFQFQARSLAAEDLNWDARIMEFTSQL